MLSSGMGNERIALDSRKRPRHDQRTDPSVKYRGVLPQQNGHWGAQIYANHQRIWLGTYRTEKEAAMAHDSASIKFQRGESQRNFPMTQHSFLKLSFQDNFSEGEVFDMIKDGVYQWKFEDFLRNLSHRSRTTECEWKLDSSWGLLSCRQLFQKELTPSDVGKLNRLVIPKKYAVKHFPCIKDTKDDPEAGAGYVDDTELVFHDRLMRVWKFRYCYWKSSQSFVFTRGWNRFVREKELRAKDVVAFYTCEYTDRADNEANMFWLIDVQYFDGGCDDNGRDPLEIKEELEEEEEEGENGVRLFGVQIN